MRKVITLKNFLIAATLLFVGCIHNNKLSQVTVHELSDPDQLNPYNCQTAEGGYLLDKIFQQLLNIDHKTLKLVGVLATDLPQIDKDSSGKNLLLTYDLRPETKWDNGNEITAKDVEFSLKVLKNPKVNDERQRSYFDFIRDIKYYPDSPKKFTLICTGGYMLSIPASGSFPIIPQYVYDPHHLMDGFTLKQLSDTSQSKQLMLDPKIIAFADSFNSVKYQRDPKCIVGSGAYYVEQWIPNQRLILARKQNWYGNFLNGDHINDYFRAYPDKLIYETINDAATALVALKSGKLDVMYGIKPKNFVDIQNHDKVKKNFNLYTPISLQYSYIGINMHNPILSDVSVRQALAHLLDVNRIIKQVGYGMGKRTIGPVNPSKKDQYNDTITPYDFNIDKAGKILADAGWSANSSGVLEKKINGVKTLLHLTIYYNTGNDQRRDACLIYKEDARKAGVDIDVVPIEWSVFLQKLHKHDFEMYYGAWISSPVDEDLEQIWGTASQQGGDNYVNFGDAKTDALIEAVRTEPNQNKRNELYKEFQVITHEQVPYIFIYSQLEKIAISKRFTNADPSSLRPGFWEPGFRTTEIPSDAN
jgi:ABC-type transport system substrate-binding protein